LVPVIVMELLSMYMLTLALPFLAACGSGPHDAISLNTVSLTEGGAGADDDVESSLEPGFFVSLRISDSVLSHPVSAATAAAESSLESAVAATGMTIISTNAVLTIAVTTAIVAIFDSFQTPGFFVSPSMGSDVACFSALLSTPTSAWPGPSCVGECGSASSEAFFSDSSEAFTSSFTS